MAHKEFTAFTINHKAFKRTFEILWFIEVIANV